MRDGGNDSSAPGEPSGPCRPPAPHRRQVPVEHRLLIGAQDAPDVVHLVSEQRPDPVARRRVRRRAGREARHLLAVMPLDRVDLCLLLRRERDVLEEQLHAAPRAASRPVLRPYGRPDKRERRRAQQHQMSFHSASFVRRYGYRMPAAEQTRRIPTFYMAPFFRSCTYTRTALAYACTPTRSSVPCTRRRSSGPMASPTNRSTLGVSWA